MKFLCVIDNEYPELSKNSTKKLLLFPTIYLREKGFSTMTNINTKQGNRINATHDMRINLKLYLGRKYQLTIELAVTITNYAIIIYYTNFFVFFL